MSNVLDGKFIARAHGQRTRHVEIFSVVISFLGGNISGNF